jgi:hypothetical protein
MKAARLARAGAIGVGLVLLSAAGAQTTRPSDAAPAGLDPADRLLNQMLRPNGQGGARPLMPSRDAPAVDRSTGTASIAPGADALPLMREGTFLIDRLGRLTRTGDGHGVEFAFEADGTALRDPPVVLLPNLKLMAMESAVKASNRDLKFRITGMVTEYNGRNHVLLEKVVVVPES